MKPPFGFTASESLQSFSWRADHIFEAILILRGGAASGTDEVDLPDIIARVFEVGSSLIGELCVELSFARCS